MKRLVLFSGLFLTSWLALIFLSLPRDLQGKEGSAKPQLAPGSLVTIPPDVDYDATYNRADMVDVLATLPKPDPELLDDTRFNPEIWAKDIRYTRDVWCLQISFKPLRIVEVDIPNKEGTFDKDAVWYLVYNVKNVGAAEFDPIVKKRAVDSEDGERVVQSVEYSLKKHGGALGTQVEKAVPMPIAEDTKTPSEMEQREIHQTRDTPLVLRNLEGTFKPEPAQAKPIQFVPQFILATDRLVLDTTSENDQETGKRLSNAETTQVAYVDQIIPLALPAIIKREGMTAIPETTVSIAKKPIQAGEDFWGVAMWTGIDPRITRFSIYISGLSNEYHWAESGNQSGLPGEGRVMERKVLKTNWWRIGDRFNLNDSQIQYGQPGTVDYEWIFR